MAAHLLGLDSSPVTRYGSVSGELHRAAAVLRARAARADVEPLPVSDVDLAAAVVAVESWMVVLHADTLERPVRHGRAAVAALSAALARVSGHGGPAVEVEPCGAGDDILEMAAGHGRWAAMVVGVEDAGEVLRRAASDLSAGSESPALCAIAGALYMTAEDLPILL